MTYVQRVHVCIFTGDESTVPRLFESCTVDGHGSLTSRLRGNRSLQERA